MNVEVPYITTGRQTHLISGRAVEQTAMSTINDRFNLGQFIVELHLVHPDQPSSRSMASEVSLRKKIKMFESIGIISRVYIHPHNVPIEIIDHVIYHANKDPHTAGIIVQLPIPGYLQGIRGKIDQVKDIDAF